MGGNLKSLICFNKSIHETSRRGWTFMSFDTVRKSYENRIKRQCANRILSLQWVQHSYFVHTQLIKVVKAYYIPTRVVDKVC